MNNLNIKIHKYLYQVKVPEDAEYYHAYKEPVIQAKINYEYPGSETSHVNDLEGTIIVLPDVSLTLNPEDIVVNTVDVQKQIPVKVKVKNYPSSSYPFALAI
ncbi:hypothetical protein V7087_24805 [Neobacillus niacini]|uniref:hypothetical protein n=1 Tax=Neobacillus niacini TaxID=86668 RepID=UPI002FFF61AC